MDYNRLFCHLIDTDHKYGNIIDPWVLDAGINFTLVAVYFPSVASVAVTLTRVYDIWKIWSRQSGK